jgi:hypothetical protein
MTEVRVTRVRTCHTNAAEAASPKVLKAITLFGGEAFSLTQKLQRFRCHTNAAEAASPKVLKAITLFGGEAFSLTQKLQRFTCHTNAASVLKHDAKKSLNDFL